MGKAGELKKHIYLCNTYEERLLNELEALNVRKKLNLISNKKYKKQLTTLLRGRPVEEWLDYYKKYKGACFNIIKEEESDRNFRGFLLIMLLFILILPFGLNYTGLSIYDENTILIDKIVSADAYMQVNGVAEPIPLQPEFYNGKYVYKIKYLTIPEHAQKIEIIDNEIVVFSKEIK